ncbi:hypothetical protein [Aquirufa sp. Wall-65K1]
MSVYPINFFDEVISFLKEMEIKVELCPNHAFSTIFLPELSLYVQCISIKDFQSQKDFSDPAAWQKQYLEQISTSTPWIRIWEDIWLKQSTWIKRYFQFRKLGNSSIFARDLRVVHISKEIADSFLENEHLLGSAQAKSYWGLVVPPHRQFRNISSPYWMGDQKLVGVATLAKPMRMKEKEFEGHISGELIRFCSTLGTQIVGGLSKVLHYYQLEEKVDNIMTYIDMEWNRGEGYQSIGFQEIQITPPILYTLNEAGKRKICKTWEEAQVCTVGNKKLRLYYSKN